MPKRDSFHEAVRTALEKEGWTITDDPLTVPTPGVDYLLVFNENTKAVIEWINK